MDIGGTAATPPDTGDGEQQMNRNSIQTRRRILLAAAESFAARGYRPTTIRDICRKAKANIASVNYHFGSKEQLYLETYEFVFAEAGDLARRRQPAAVRTAEEWERELRRWIHTVLEQIVNPRRTALWQCRMFSRERCEPSKVLPVMLQQFFLPIRDDLHRLLQMALPPDTDEATLQLWGINVIGQCTMFAQREPPWDKLLFPAGWTRQEWLERSTEHIFQNITARLRFGGAPADGARPARTPG
jgi:AcrR family transcriptional regulator